MVARMPVNPPDGPQSALTDFLASHNISANQIRLDHQRRLQQAQADDDQAASGPSNTAPNGADGADDGADDGPDVAEEDAKKPGKRRQETQKAIEKIKASKRFQKRKKRLQGSDDENDLINELLKASGPAPGQMENCEICSVRFTVTPYSRAGPDGGLLCNPCGKDIQKEEGPVKKKKKVVASGGAVGRRRKTQSNLLDGTYSLGAKSLMSLCIETLAKNIELADDLGEMPPRIIDKIARMLSKKRLVDPNTLNLFLQPTAQDISIYDGAKLSTDDYMRVFQMVPTVKNLKIRNAIQFKDEVMEYLLSRDKVELEGLYMHGANLISAEMWKKYLTTKGKTLQRFQIYYTDKHFDDECITALRTAAPELKRLKVSNNQKVSGDGIRELVHLKKLQHLGIHVHNHVHSDIYVEVLRSIGSELRTLSLRRTPELDNTVLDAIHNNCRHLSKLRITDSEVMTDAGFARLFTDWRNPGLTFLDLQKCRHVDSQKPRENPDDIGLCSEGFKALMAHSGKSLQKLNLHACRHISKQAFDEVFSPKNTYSELKSLELSFCEDVNDYVVGSVFRSCPNLRELNVFGCMRVKNARVPRGKILVGVPNALGMVIEGQD
ncbi:nucleotide exsicion repair protein rad7 [Diaporthe amygdali]|uniref:nucleotide exsicion repair protein rad7 n=1 Tax=Phomopsis amygdali TaxID=1214568 RepID=UPI0022FE02FE|nr:nucleotide exsicion repair protein rad7 [Diaporthe amygdali]KAJ0117160.1 nucleotide exsicion repair protein rad7 [Diaporthe amygdali]